MPQDNDTWQLTRVVADEEIGNRILGQATGLQPDTYVGAERSKRFFGILLDVAKNLVRARYQR